MVVEKDIQKKELLCDSCENLSICKFASDMDSLAGKIHSLRLQYNTQPFIYSVGCGRFRSNNKV